MWYQLAVVVLAPYIITTRIKAVPNWWGLAFLHGRDSEKRSSFSISVRLILAVFKMLKEEFPEQTPTRDLTTLCLIRLVPGVLAECQ